MYYFSPVVLSLAEGFTHHPNLNPPYIVQPILSLLILGIFARSKFTSTRFVYFIGPTCVGKGYLMKLILAFLKHLTKRKLINIGVVSFGDIVKNLLKSDASFRSAYEATIRNGDLVPDHEVIPIFQHEIEKFAQAGMPNLILVDGFCRSPRQISFAEENGYLSADDTVMMIEASEEVCLARFMHRCRGKPGDEKRIDAELPTFHHRYRAHQRIAPELRGMFREMDCRLIEIDGNRDIAGDVAPEVLGHLEPHVDAAYDAEKYGPTVAHR